MFDPVSRVRGLRPPRITRPVVFAGLARDVAGCPWTS